MHKELRKMVNEAEAQGFETRRTSKGHIQVSKDGRIVSVFAGTPSDQRSWRNSLAALKRAGFKPRS